MRTYDKRVVNRLLDLYENSLLSTGENRRTIHIDLAFTKKEMPEYYDTSSTAFETIHNMMRELERRGLIEILWKDGKADHVIKKVRLLSAPDAYAYAGRLPKTELEARQLRMIEDFIQSSPEETVLVKFARYLSDRLRQHASVREYLELEDPEAARRLLSAVQCVESNETPCYIREFSIKHFHDSKYFEQVRQRVAGIFRRFGSGLEQMDEREILAEYGIYHTPNYVFFKGSALLMVRQETIRLGNLSQGIGLSGDDLDALVIPEDGQNRRIRRVMTIENLTTFFRWQAEDGLVIYLGGYHNGVRRTLLQTIYRTWPQAEYLHFGDIDAGGFLILDDLRKKTGIPFKAWHMDLETLTAYEEYAKPLTASDRHRLEALQEIPEWEETIRYMLEKDIKLEQECVKPSGM